MLSSTVATSHMVAIEHLKGGHSEFKYAVSAKYTPDFENLAQNIE